MKSWTTLLLLVLSGTSTLAGAAESAAVIDKDNAAATPVKAEQPAVVKAPAKVPAKTPGAAVPAPDAAAATNGKNSTFVPSVEISEDLSVSFPTDI